MRRLLPPQHLLLLLQNPWLLPLPQPRLNNLLPLLQNRLPPLLLKQPLQPSLPNLLPMLRQAQQPKLLQLLSVALMPQHPLPLNQSLLKNLP